ncbi:IS66 family transposase [Vibrio mimicus]
MKKKNHFIAEPPNVSNLGEANALIRELWTKLHEYEDRLAQNSRNSSRSPSSDTLQARAERPKAQRPCRRNQAGAQPGHKGQRRPLSELKVTDTVVRCTPDTCCQECGGEVIPNSSPTYRHQIFELPKVALDITEYQLFHGRCQHCNHTTRASLPDDAPSGQMEPRLLSHVAVLAGQYHLSISKIQRLLRDQYGTHFSTGAISEAQGKVSAMLTPVHQALHHHVKQSAVIHIDETTHNRNGEAATRWVWLLSGSDAVYQNIRYFRNAETARSLLDEASPAVVVTDQCASYNWLDSTRHQFCWAHVIRNLKQMAEYSGSGLTAHIGQRLVRLCYSVFRVQHRYENGDIDEARWRSRMARLRKRLTVWLRKGEQVPSWRYAGRCRHILKHEQGLWVFLSQKGVSLTNNEAERCLRGSVIMRKICFGTSSHRGEQFRSRVLSVVETCKKRGLSALDTISNIVTAVVRKQAYPDVFGLTSS